MDEAVKEDIKGSKELLEDVINNGLCTLCGACAGACPYLVSYQGRIVVLDECTLSEGQCYQYCPRTRADMDALSQEVFGQPYGEEEIGTTKEVLMSRSADTRVLEKAQYGGTVTTLLSLAMDEGLINTAVLTRETEDKMPVPFLARSPEEVLEGAGSNYMVCPVLEGYNRIPADSVERVGMVVTPCQGLAVSKMKLIPPQHRPSSDNIGLVIGLFCTWALSQESFGRFLRDSLNLAKIKKFDIPPPPANRLDVYTLAGRVSFPLDQIREFKMPTCSYCLDMTSEFADVSVGSVEGVEGWNTVIIRTDTGADLVKLARDRGMLETAALPEENLKHLKEAALLKKKRALKEIINRTGDKDDLLYLDMSPELVGKLLA